MVTGYSTQQVNESYSGTAFQPVLDEISYARFESVRLLI